MFFKIRQIKIYIKTKSGVVDCILCSGYDNEKEAIADLRLKYDNYQDDFIITEDEYKKAKGY